MDQPIDGGCGHFCARHTLAGLDREALLAIIIDYR